MKELCGILEGRSQVEHSTKRRAESQPHGLRPVLNIGRSEKMRIIMLYFGIYFNINVPIY